MKVTADTNVLVRFITDDDPVQSPLADKVLASATVVAIPLPALCEVAWVLRQNYRARPSDVAEALRRVVDGGNVEVDRRAVAAGLALLEAGGDFADGVIAHAGAELGGETFISFDKKAVALLQAQGVQARLLG